MLWFKVRSARSWLSDTYGKVLATQLAERLVTRCKGERGVFITLTYDRTPYDDPAELYRAAREDRHVRLFMRKLSKYLGESLAGRWLCKLEFQRGGWVHWHILLLGVDFIDHGDLTAAWGHGHVLIKRMTERTIRYACKYVSKDGQVPAYLFNERIRSVKIIRVSPGFWREVEESQSEEGEKGDGSREECREPPGPVRLPMYVTIGEVIERSECSTVLRDDDGRFADVKLSPVELWERLQSRGARIVRTKRGWCGLQGVDWSDVAAAVAEEGQGGLSAAPPPALYLKSGGNPHTGRRVPKWLERYFAWKFGWRKECLA